MTKGVLTLEKMSEAIEKAMEAGLPQDVRMIVPGRQLNNVMNTDKFDENATYMLYNGEFTKMEE